MAVFLWVILYGLVYSAAASTDCLWILPAGMLAYTAALLIRIRRAGYSGKIGLRKCPVLSPGMLPLFALPLGNLLLGGFRFPGWAAGTVLVCICVTEEVFFRGFLLHWLLNKGTERAVLGTSLCFGLMHFANLPAGADAGYTLIQVLCAFWVSVCYCRVTLRWGSLVPCIAAHILTNLTASGSSDDGRQLPVMAAVIFAYACYSHWLKKTQKERMP